MIPMVYWLQSGISERIEYRNLLNYGEWADFRKLYVAICLFPLSNWLGCIYLRILTYFCRLSHHNPKCSILFIHVFSYSSDGSCSNAWFAFLVFRHRYHDRHSALWPGLPTNEGGLKRGHPLPRNSNTAHGSVPIFRAVCSSKALTSYLSNLLPFIDVFLTPDKFDVLIRTFFPATRHSKSRNLELLAYLDWFSLQKARELCNYRKNR